MPDQIISPFERAFAAPIETYRQVDSVANRDSIPTGVRWIGMQVHVVQDQKTYELRGGIGNGNWFDTSSEVDVVVEDNVTSTSIVNALSANQGRLLNEKFDDYVPSSGGTFTGVVTGVNFVTSSDRKLKTDISSYKPRVIDVDWVEWNWAKGGKRCGRRQLGVIAQDLEKKHPEFVLTDSETKLKAVDYVQLLIAKVVELEHRINIYANAYS